MKFVDPQWIEYEEYSDKHDLVAHYTESINPNGKIIIGTAILNKNEWYGYTIFNRSYFPHFSTFEECKECVDNIVKEHNGVLCPEIP